MNGLTEGDLSLDVVELGDAQLVRAENGLRKMVGSVGGHGDKGEAQDVQVNEKIVDWCLDRSIGAIAVDWPLYCTQRARTRTTTEIN